MWRESFIFRDSREAVDRLSKRNQDPEQNGFFIAASLLILALMPVTCVSCIRLCFQFQKYSDLHLWRHKVNQRFVKRTAL